MPSYTVEALVIKRSNFSEKDRLFTLLSPNHGKIRAIGKSVRRPGSKMAGHLELLSHAKVYLAKGRNLDIITQVESLSRAPVFGADLSRLSLAFYVSEVVSQLTHEGEENYSLFRLVQDTLRELPSIAKPAMLIARFEYQLIALMGYAPDYESCVVSGHSIVQDSGWSNSWQGWVAHQMMPQVADYLPVSADCRHCLAQLEHCEIDALPEFAPAVIDEICAITRSMVEHRCEKQLPSSAFAGEVALLGQAI